MLRHQRANSRALIGVEDADAAAEQHGGQRPDGESPEFHADGEFSFEQARERIDRKKRRKQRQQRVKGLNAEQRRRQRRGQYERDGAHERHAEAQDEAGVEGGEIEAAPRNQVDRHALAGERLADLQQQKAYRHRAEGRRPDDARDRHEHDEGEDLRSVAADGRPRGAAKRALLKWS